MTNLTRATRRVMAVLAAVMVSGAAIAGVYAVFHSSERRVAPRVIAPSAQPGEAERALEEWLAAWRRRHYDRMATWTATTPWRRTGGVDADETGDDLRERFGTRRLLGWTVHGRRAVDGGFDFLLEAAMSTPLHPAVRREMLSVRVVRGAHEERTGAHCWGVDPLRVIAASPLA